MGDDPDVSELEVQREELDKKLRALKDDQTNNINDIKYFLKKYLTLLSSLPRLKKMYSLIKEKEENKQLPPKYDKADLEKMLSEHHCDVCNRELDTDATIYIAELIKRFELGQETGTLLTRMLGPLQMQIQEASRFEVERDKLYSAKAKIETEISDVAAKVCCGQAFL